MKKMQIQSSSYLKCCLALASTFIFLSSYSAEKDATTKASTINALIKRFVPRDGCESFQNPGNGRYSGHWIWLKAEGNKPRLFKQDRDINFCCLWQIAPFSGGNSYRDKPIPLKEIGGEDKPISEDALNAMEQTLASARSNGVTVLVRVGYTSEEVFGAEPSKFETLLSHQEQVGKLISKYPDVVTTIECGMIGPWAEMHSTNYHNQEHLHAMIQKWIDVTPSTVAILVRAPNHIVDYVGAESAEAFFNKDRKRLSGEDRIGMYNDGYLGTDWDYGTWGGGKKGFNRAQGVSYLETRACVPYGGECAYVDDAGARKVTLLDPSKYNIVQEFYRTHLSYLRNITQKISLIQYLDSLMFDTKTYAFEGMPDLTEYEGKSIRKFIEDHLGYRYVVRKVNPISSIRSGSTLYLNIEIENTGFSQARLPAVAEVVFTQGTNSVAVAAKMSSKVTDWKSATKNKVKIIVRVPKTLKRGTADVALRLRVPMQDEKMEEMARRPIRFANEGM